MTHQCTLTERDNAVLRVTLNRPEKLNALSLQLVTELSEIADDIRNDATIRAVLLTGAGRAFCTGADLKDPGLAGLTGHPARAQVSHALRSTMNPMMQRWYRLPVPVVVAVNGVAAGAGVSLALVGDIVTATESATFSLPFATRLGIIPDLGATFGLPRHLSAARIKGLTLLGGDIPARTAVEWGLIWSYVGDNVFADHATATARQLARGPTRAIAALKTILADGKGASLESLLEREADLQSLLADTDDFREGLDAFREKREPNFRGK
jgi:2-(1,2-epoxy-1,2-dihydrophenyl)acetyl-CoA isomerase